VFGTFLEKLPKVLRHLYCVLLVMLGWNLFMFGDFTQSLTYFNALFGGYGAGLWNTETIYLFLNHAVLLVVLIVGCTQLPKKIGNAFTVRFAENDVVILAARGLLYVGIFLLSVAWLVDASYNPFLYFRF